MEEGKTGRRNGKMRGIKDQSSKIRKITEKRKQLGKTKLENKVGVS